MPDSFPFMSNFSTDTAGEISAIAKNLRGRVPDADIHASRAIARGDSVEAFRAEMISMMPSVQPMQKPMMSDVKPKEWARYSLSSAIRGIVNGGGVSGFEREMSDEVAKRGGQSASGFWVPGEILNRSFVAGTASLGGDLVQTSNLGSEFIELLRNRPMCEQLGARVLNLNGPCTIPRQSGAGVANWLGETVASTLSVGNFTQLTLTPTAVSAFQQYSKQLAITSAPGIEQLILSDINSIINLAVDRACLHGSGSGEPLGIASTAGVSSVTVAMLAPSALTSTLHPFFGFARNERCNQQRRFGRAGLSGESQNARGCKGNDQVQRCRGTPCVGAGRQAERLPGGCDESNCDQLDRWHRSHDLQRRLLRQLGRCADCQLQRRGG